MSSSYQILRFRGSDVPSAYIPMIQSWWLRSLRFGNDLIYHIDRKTYFTVHRKIIDVILLRPSTVVRIAVMSDDHDIGLGFSVMEPSKLHYVYVVPLRDGQVELRRHGMGTALVPEPFTSFTHITKVGFQIWKEKFKEAKFNPYEIEV